MQLKFLKFVLLCVHCYGCMFLCCVGEAQLVSRLDYAWVAGTDCFPLIIPLR